MSNQFKIRQHLSSNAKRRTAMVTVEFQGRVFTRHIKDGIGRHPDDSLPGIYRKLEERIAFNKQDQAMKLEAITMFKAKKPENWEDHVVALEMQRQRLVDELQVLMLSLDAMKKEDPLMVSYI